MSVCVVVGLGPNSVEVPCLVFPDREAAAKFLTQKLGEPKPWNPYEEDEEEEGPFENAWAAPYDEDDDTESAMAPFFTSYYDGCGGVSAFVIREVEYGTPFVGFNLD